MATEHRREVRALDALTNDSFFLPVRDLAGLPDRDEKVLISIARSG
jgi:hypothetical protein